MDYKKSVSIIIVNFHSADLVINCIRALEAEISQIPGVHAIIVDNASVDQSVEKIESEISRNNWGSWVSLITEKENKGYGAGNNSAIRSIQQSQDLPEFFWLLNPDTLVKPGALRALLEHMKAVPKSGIAGSRLESPRSGQIECSAYHFLNPLGEIWQAGADLNFIKRFFVKYLVSPPISTMAHECDWVSGASLFIRREVLDIIGLFDEEYFLCFEDIDLCYRAKKAGWQVWYLPLSQVIHRGGISRFSFKLERRPGYWHKSRRRFFIKTQGYGGLLWADFFFSLGLMIVFIEYLFRLMKKIFISLMDTVGGDLSALFDQRKD